MTSVAFLLRPVVLLLSFYEGECNGGGCNQPGCSIFPTFTKEDAQELVKCVAENGPEAVEEYKNCSDPVVPKLILDYCINLTYTKAKDITEAFQQGKCNPCLVDDVYDCINENIHCITCHEKYEEVIKWEDCFRDIVDKYCCSNKYSRKKRRRVHDKIKHEDRKCCVKDC